MRKEPLEKRTAGVRARKGRWKKEGSAGPWELIREVEMKIGNSYIPFLARSEREEKEFAFLVMYKTPRYIEAIANPPPCSHSF